MLCDFVQETAENFGMFGLLQKERGKVQFFLDMTLLRYDHHEGQQVERDALFTGLKERGQLQDGILLFIGAALPVEDVLREINAARVPYA